MEVLMIQIYDKTNLNYDTNGDVVVEPTKCELEVELNGSWELTLEHPIDEEGKWKHIVEGAVIAATSFSGNTQLFRIYNRNKSDLGVIAYARPIFLDSAGEIFLIDTRPTEKTGQQALNEMLKGQTKYKGSSNITGKSTAYYIRKNLIEALESDEDQSFLNRWGGEVIYDNYNIIINARAGGDYGAHAEMGHNCTGIEEEIDMDEVVTRIIPVAYNGYTLSGEEPWVDSKNIGNYPVIYAKEIKFEDVKLQIDAEENEKSFKTIEDLRKELKRRCEEQFELGIDLPKCSYKCNMIDLSNTEEYQDVKMLETVGIGDTVHCKNKRIHIETDARVIKLTWDCIEKKNTSVDLGDFEYNYFGELTSVAGRVEKTIRPDGTIIAEEVRGIIDGAVAQLRLQNTVAKKTDERAFLTEDLDPDSPLFGAMCYGTQGFQIANKRTPDGKDWDWSTFGTPEGFIATYLIAGFLISQNYSPGKSGFKFSLDDGTIDSKHLKLDAAGLLTVYKALIDGGEITIQNTSGKEIFKVNEDGFWFGEDGGSIKYTEKDRLLTLYKALINGGEITIQSTSGETIFRVTEKGFWFGEGGGSIRYIAEEKIIEILKNIKLSGTITNYSTTGKKSIVIGNNKVDVYSWKDDGDYVGSLGALATADDEDSRKSLGLYSDGNDCLKLGYLTTGGKVKTLLSFDPTRIGRPPESPSRRAIKLSEIPEIPGTFSGEYYIGTTKQYFCNGILYAREQGETYTGTFTTGAEETATIQNGVIKNIE